ncbi:protein-glutamine gamma-glutamyltransferase [Geobacillus sp. NFOSA3]|uniref:Protein-glutamine gamma-glutamyltransferase n=1 Tax=Parageobacillus galactosidasius TaxID=883812 RepID=A0A226QM67_9BACL|nr:MULTISPECIES: protein-glutamine gamma-glutamyltransferase [Bacillaceae]NNU94836.1 protein-glutamine gamma-glutamyltransferase [Geobacillus sp. NFOSA3]OQP00667.1 protein-glutamine gamma-glutamyltransferase [Geobacillus sp. 44C]PDM41712.1 protein-glutamine gamma-glutamyltransferase [Parageobacillus yumthangensis]MED4971360.1 protein-glutamine gamma-glutamyltransferase [Parageobacillus toebii]MED4990900.1 protein-glutamine gamma-glutamyltransferase [Parageobacillus toebii]
MIKIQDTIVYNDFLAHSSLSKKQEKIFEALLKSPETYVYKNEHQLLFEIILRDRIIDTAISLAKSKVRFAIFRLSKCNEQFWIKNELGGFQLKEGVLPSDAINDIFINSHLYAFECATAIVIVFYKAVLDVMDKQTFNRLFSNLLLYDWHVDQDLGVKTKKGEDYLPGDCLYFKNPEFDPQTPQWQGENTIYLGNDLHYGHGIGIKTSEEIIAALNKKRKKDATKSAYLLPQTTRVDFIYLSQFSSTPGGYRLPINKKYFITGTLGSATFLYW